LTGEGRRREEGGEKRLKYAEASGKAEDGKGDVG